MRSKVGPWKRGEQARDHEVIEAAVLDGPGDELATLGAAHELVDGDGYDAVEGARLSSEIPSSSRTPEMLPPQRHRKTPALIACSRRSATVARAAGADAFEQRFDVLRMRRHAAVLVGVGPQGEGEKLLHVQGTKGVLLVRTSAR